MRKIKGQKRLYTALNVKKIGELCQPLLSRARQVLVRHARIPTSQVSVLKEDATMSPLMLRISLALTLFLMADGVALANKIIGNG